MWVSLLLILLALIFSFTSIITLNTGEHTKGINEMIAKFSSSTDYEIPENIEVSAPKIVSSVSLISKIIGVSIDSAKAANGTLDEAGAEKLANKQKELDTYLGGEKGKRDVVTASAIAVSVINIFDFEGLDGSFGLILSAIVAVVGFFVSLALVIIIPITLIVHFITALILCVKNVGNPENASAVVGSKLSSMLTMPIILMLFQCVVPGVSYASGILAVTIIAAVSVLINLIVSRAREYKPDQFVYLNIVQIPAFISIIGFLVFFFSLIKTGIFKTFIGGSFFNYMELQMNMSKFGVEIDYGFLIDALLFVLYLFFAFSCVKYLEKAARRVSCTVKLEKTRFGKQKTPKDNALVTSILALFVFLIPAFLASRQHGDSQATFLELSKDQTGALTAVLIGALIMLIADVAVIVLRSTYAKIDVERRSEVLTGRAQACEDTEVADSDQEPAEATEGEAAASSEEAEAESEIEAEEEAEIEAKVEAEAEAEVEAEVEAEAEVETEEAKK